MGKLVEIPFQVLRDKSWIGRQAKTKAAKRVVNSGHYILGQNVARFEKDFAIDLGVEFAIGTANGMDSIEIGLRALELKRGDEVITTAVTAFATILGITRAGATPVLAEINPHTGLLDPEEVERKITSNTRALLLVHLYGHMDRMDEWTDLTSRNGIELVEDCAQAHLASWNGVSAGGTGALGAFSFYPTKNLGALGDAGAITTNRNDLAEASMMLRNYGQSDRYHHEHLGLNSRLDEIQASFLQLNLKNLREKTVERQNVAKRYVEGIKSDFVTTLTKPAANENHVYHLFVVKSKHRDELHEYLGTKGIQTLIHYPIPAHHQQAWIRGELEQHRLPTSEQFCQQVLSLPCRPGLRSREVSHVIESVNSFRPQ